jgi:GTPase SAR1 family protein
LDLNFLPRRLHLKTIYKLNYNFGIQLISYYEAGQENFKSIIRSFYRNAVGVFLVYDITKYLIIISKQSFENLNGWLNESKDNSKKNAVFILIGN